MKNINPLGLFDDQLEFQIVDQASFKRFVEVPRQRNTREENKHIKETGTALIPVKSRIKYTKKRK